MTNNLGDPFNPKNGEFAKNIRSTIGGDDTELRESLKRWGWIKEFPALVDENDVTLVGHRRLKLAKQLKIEPVIKKLRLGTGDEADAERLKLAIASNIGGQPLTRDDRKRIAEHLYGAREWTMERIAEALNVSAMTVSNDLEGFKPTLKPHRPKGGRPKGSGERKSSAKRSAPTPHPQRTEFVALADQGLSNSEIAVETGVSEHTIRREIEREEIKRETAPLIKADDLSLTAQQKLETAIRQHTRKLDIDFELRVRKEVDRRLSMIIMPEWKRQIEEAQDIFNNRKGILDKASFRKIQKCLHADTRLHVSEKQANEAFDIFNGLEKLLLNEKDSPTTFTGLPTSQAGWDELRRRAAAKKAKRGHANVTQR